MSKEKNKKLFSKLHRGTFVEESLIWFVLKLIPCGLRKFLVLYIRGKLIPLRITPFLYHHGYMYLLTEERVGKLEVKKHEGRVGSEI